jgi:hypothetical protein
MGYDLFMRAWRPTAVLVVLLGVAAGCGADQGADARATAMRFTDAVSSGDHSLACSLLAPETKAQLEQAVGKPCAAAIAEEDLPAADALEHAAVFGTMAQMRFAGDTVFVSQFPRGWRVLAAGCSPLPGQPYDCRLQGG